MQHELKSECVAIISWCAHQDYAKCFYFLMHT